MGRYVNYSMHRVRMLKYFGVTPLIVFDGGLLPSKMGTEGDREKCASTSGLCSQSGEADVTRS